MINLIITVLAIVICMLLARKYPIQISFLFVGLLLALGFTVLTGTSVAGSSSGNIYIDILELLKEKFVSTFSSTGMSIVPIVAYSAYMDKIQATPVLGNLIAKPISKAKNPYFAGIFLVICLGAVMRIAIVSAIALLALLMSLLMPVLTKAGISKQSAAAAIFLGVCFDWGPADLTVVQILVGIDELNATDYFFQASLKIVPILVLVITTLSSFLFWQIDKKSGYKIGDHYNAMEEKDTSALPPKFYAILPMLPLVFILIFSPLFNHGVTISVMSAVVLSLFVSFIIEIIRKKNIQAQIADFMVWFQSAGVAFGRIVALIVCVQYFSALLMKLKGFDWLVNTTLSAGLSGYVLLIIFSLILFVVGLLMGTSGLVVGIALAPQAVAVGAALGISSYAALLPVQVAMGLECLNLGTGTHIQYVMKESDSTVGQILQRVTLPCIVMYILSFVLSMFLL